MPKELNGLSDTMIFDGEEFPHKCGQEDRAMKEAREGGWGHPNDNVIQFGATTMEECNTCK